MENKDKVIEMIKETYFKENNLELNHERAVEEYNKMNYLSEVIYDHWIESLKSE